jgi:hypothetical protein
MDEQANSLQLGIAAHNAGDKGNARTYFLKAVREEPNSEQAWGWLSNTAINKAERIHCLQQIIRINPENTSAGELLKQLETTDWVAAAPPVQVPAPSNVATPVSSATSAAAVAPSPAIPAGTGSDTMQTLIIILLVLLVLFWLGVGFLQLVLSLSASNTFDLLCFGGVNIIVSIINGVMIAPVAKKKKSALQQLYSLSILGALFGMFQLFFSSAYLQVCALPLYILLGILTYLNRDVFVN